MSAPPSGPRPPLGEVAKKYAQASVRERIEAFFLDNLGKVVTRRMILQAASDPRTGEEPENWHQRLSELRTDAGYAILSHRDRPYLRPGEYLMETAEKNLRARSRTLISEAAWAQVLRRSGNRCEWRDGQGTCGLSEGDADPVGGGTVHLTPDHKTPHSSGEAIDASNPDEWQSLCGRHQVVKKNFWDDRTGKLNVYAIVQAAPKSEKRMVYEFLKQFFAGEEGRKEKPR